MVNNSLEKNFLKYRDESSEEIAFKNKLAEIFQENNIDISYYVSNPMYFIEHLMPLYHVFPAKLCGLRLGGEHRQFIRGEVETSYMEQARFLLKRYGFDKDDYFLVFTNEEQRRQYLKDSFIVSCLGSGMEGEKNYFNIGHGNDEADLYHNDQTLDPNKPLKKLTTVFTKFNESYYEKPDILKAFYRIDPAKKTIVFFPTVPPWDFLSRDTPKHIYDKTLSDLIQLKKEFNVVVRLHPLQKFKIDQLEKHFIIAPNGHFRSIIPYYKLADVVIAPVGSGASAATRYPDIPIVLLRPDISFSKRGGGTIDMKSISNRNKGVVLDETSTVLQTEVDIDLPARVRFALNDPDRINKVSLRKKYFSYRFGCIDGYEEYRYFIDLLKKNKLVNQAEQLEKLYSVFPIYGDRKNCLSVL